MNTEWKKKDQPLFQMKHLSFIKALMCVNNLSNDLLLDPISDLAWSSFFEILPGIITVGSQDTQKPVGTREFKPTRNLSAKNSLGKPIEFMVKIF